MPIQRIHTVVLTWAWALTALPDNLAPCHATNAGHRAYRSQSKVLLAGRCFSLVGACNPMWCPIHVSLDLGLIHAFRSNSTIVTEEIPGTTPKMTVSAAFAPVPLSVHITAASPTRQFLVCNFDIVFGPFHARLSMSPPMRRAMGLTWC